MSLRFQILNQKTEHTAILFGTSEKLTESSFPKSKSTESCQKKEMTYNCLLSVKGDV